MGDEFSGPARLIGIVAAAIILIAALAYGVTLALGFASLASPAQPIGNPYFTILELLILVLAPAMVVLMAAVHAWAPRKLRGLSLAAVCMMVMLATETSCVHFVILTLKHQPGYAGQDSMDVFLAFKWPSVVYALDILGWDVFFALSMLLAAPVFGGSRLGRSIRAAMITSGALAFAGLAGVAFGNMVLRDIGIAGYLGAFLVVDTLLLALFVRTKAVPSSFSGSLAAAPDP
jgi:hypothetical protein